MKLEAFIDIRDEYGKLESRKKANSLIMNFIDLLCVQMGQASQNITDDLGNSRAVSTNALNFAANGAVGTTTFGIRVGTGTNAVTLTDTALQTPIAHGTGAGELSHGAVSVSAPATSGTSRQFTVSRTFTNNSGSDITVKEVGISVRGTASLWYFCVDRTLNTFTVSDGTSKTVTYTIKVTV